MPGRRSAEMPSVQELIVNALRRKLVVTAMHQGYDRIMCPHVIGNKNGNLNAFFFQFAGGSKLGLRPDDNGDACV
jgi:hypothetical protein